MDDEDGMEEMTENKELPEEEENYIGEIDFSELEYEDYIDKFREEDKQVAEEEIEEEISEEHGAVRTTRPNSRASEEMSNVRFVDMKKYYPDESVDSIAKSEEDEEKEEATSEVPQDEEKYEFEFDDYLAFMGESAYDEGEMVEMPMEVHEIEDLEEEGVQGDLYSEPSDKFYEQVCELETPISTDESFVAPGFRYAHRRKVFRGEAEEDQWFPDLESDESAEGSSNSLKYLKEQLGPVLVECLLEAGSYQPTHAVRFMAHSLLQKAKSREELGLDPDPRALQALVDENTKQKKLLPWRKLPAFLGPMRESGSDLFVPATADVKASTTSSEVEKPTPIGTYQRKFKKAKKKLISDEKEKRSLIDMKSIEPGSCLGPTSLPLPPKVISKEQVDE